MRDFAWLRLVVALLWTTPVLRLRLAGLWPWLEVIDLGLRLLGGLLCPCGRLRPDGGLRPNFFTEVTLTDFLGGVKPLPRPRDRRLPGGGLHPRGAHDGREEG